ncbi:MAG: DMT family transporter [Spirochaetota bacterium]
MERSPVKARIALFIAMVIWATSFIALKTAFRSYDPMFVILGRQFLAAAVFLVLFPSLRRRQSIRRKDVPFMILMAFFEPCLYFIFEAEALVNTSASQAGMITSMLPLLVAVAAFFILKESLTPRTVTGFAAAVAGAVVLSVFSDTTDTAPRPVLGNILEFIAMLCATGYTISLKRLSSRYDPFYLTAIQCFVGTVFFLPLAVFSGGFPSVWDSVPALSIVYLGIAVSLGAYGLYNYGISKIDASRGAAFVNLIPVFTILFGWLILGETMNVYQYAGCALVFAGVYISQKK